jgi:hypothetical protein
MPRPCRDAKGLYCLSHLMYTVRPCLIHTCHAAPVPCHDRAVLKATSQGNCTARHGHGMACELASAVHTMHVGDVPTFGFFRLPRVVPRRLFQKYTNPLKCRASSSDISGYHADFHDGHGTVGEWQGRGMACVN